MATLITALVAFMLGGLFGLTVMALIIASRDRRSDHGSSFHQPLRPLRTDDDGRAASPRSRRY